MLYLCVFTGIETICEKRVDRHPPKKIKRDSRGREIVFDVFQKVITAGDPINFDEPVKVISFQSAPTSPFFRIPLWLSILPNPEYVTDPYTYKIGEFKIKCDTKNGIFGRLVLSFSSLKIHDTHLSAKTARIHQCREF